MNDYIISGWLEKLKDAMLKEWNALECPLFKYSIPLQASRFFPTKVLSMARLHIISGSTVSISTQRRKTRHSGKVLDSTSSFKVFCFFVFMCSYLTAVTETFFETFYGGLAYIPQRNSQNFSSATVCLLGGEPVFFRP
jgi:hypothetical protein